MQLNGRRAQSFILGVHLLEAMGMGMGMVKGKSLSISDHSYVWNR